MIHIYLACFNVYHLDEHKQSQGREADLQVRMIPRGGEREVEDQMAREAAPISISTSARRVRLRSP
jgi:hypothetical protein